MILINVTFNISNFTKKVYLLFYIHSEILLFVYRYFFMLLIIDKKPHFIYYSMPTFTIFRTILCFCPLFYLFTFLLLFCVFFASDICYRYLWWCPLLIFNEYSLFCIINMHFLYHSIYQLFLWIILMIKFLSQIVKQQRWNDDMMNNMLFFLFFLPYFVFVCIAILEIIFFFIVYYRGYFLCFFVCIFFVFVVTFTLNIDVLLNYNIKRFL